MKKYAVVVAGGSGTRMGSVLPKQFISVHGKPLLWYTLSAFLKAFEDIQLIVVLPDFYHDIGRSICNEIPVRNTIHTVTGGQTRFHSVQNGLEAVMNEGIICVHDAVRCLVSPLLIRHCFEEAELFGTAIPCVASKDSVRLLSGDEYKPVNRTDIRLVQTPQTFQSSILLGSYQSAKQKDFTDDASVVEAAGYPIHVVDGDVNNFKITTPLDLLIAEILLK